MPLPVSESVRRQRVAADPLVVVARRRHPHIRRGFDLATYLGQQHVMVTSRRKGPGVEDIALSERGLQRRIRLRCRNYLAAFRVVGESDLVLTMAERYAGVLNLGFGHRILPLPLAMPTLDLYLYWHDAVDQDPASRWLRALVQQVFAGDASGATKRPVPAAVAAAEALVAQQQAIARGARCPPGRSLIYIAVDYSRGAMKSGQMPLSAASARPSRPRQNPSSTSSAR